MQPIDLGSINFDIHLTYAERFAALLLIIGSALLFLSAGQAEQSLRQEEAGIQSTAGSDLSPKTAVDSLVISLFGWIIIATIATIRLKEREQKIASGQDKGPLTPNLNITSGAWIAVIGSIFLLIGLIQREQQLVPVTIL